MAMDTKETLIAITVLNPGVALEVHHYNISSGEVFFIFEA